MSQGRDLPQRRRARRLAASGIVQIANVTETPPAGYHHVDPACATRTGST